MAVSNKFHHALATLHCWYLRYRPAIEATSHVRMSCTSVPVPGGSPTGLHAQWLPQGLTGSEFCMCDSAC